jgi:general secretion pathway protein A
MMPVDGRSTTHAPGGGSPPGPSVPKSGPRPLLELFPPSAEGPPTSSLAELHDSLRRTPVGPPVQQPIEPPDYETFYGLREQPFSLASSDLKFLYHSSAHDRAAQTMLGAIWRREGVVLLTGEMGIGKTMLCQAVVEQLDRRTVISFITESFAAPEDLLRKVLGDFGVISRADLAAGKLRNAPREELSSALRDFLFSLAPLQAFAVVIIDEAQDLSVDVLDEIRLLADAERDERLLQVVLVGQPSLTAMLARRRMRGLAQRISVRWTLGPLAAEEIAGYVGHRLSVAGANARVEFDDRAIHRIFEISRGVPRIVNVLCDRALSAGWRISAGIIDDRLVRTAAEDLELAPRLSRASTFGAAVLIAILVLFAGVGAGIAAYVLREELATVMSDWQDIPAPPPGPIP